MNNCCIKTLIILGIIILFSFQSILSQDTLNYRFFPPIKIQISDDSSEESDTVDWDISAQTLF